MLKQDFNALESIQRRFTKYICGLEAFLKTIAKLSWEHSPWKKDAL